MKLAELLTPDLIALGLRSGNHEDAIVELVDRLAAAKQLSAEFTAEITDALKTREEQISTGIGHGVAIPHAFTENSEEVLAVLGRSSQDRKSTRLNSSHVEISYAVFCLKKKKNT